MAYSEGKKFNKPGSGGGKKHPFSKFSDKKGPKKRAFDGDKKRGEGEGGEKERKFGKSGGRFKKPFKRDEGEKKPFRKFDGDKDRKKSFEKKEGDRPFKRTYNKDGDHKKPYEKKEGDRPFKRSYSKDGDNRKTYEKKEGDHPFKRSYNKDDDHKKPYEKKEGDRPFKRSYSKDGDHKKSYAKKEGDYKKPYEKKEGDRPFKRSFSKDGDHKKSYEKKEGDRPFKRSYGKDGDHKKSYEKKEGDRPFKRSFSKDGDDRKKSYVKKEDDRGEKRPFDSKNEDGHYRPFKKEYSGEKKHHDGDKKYGRDEALRSRKKHKEKPVKEFDGLTRLNKYLSNAGICSRREADDLIRAGAVSVNGKVITEMGFKVKSDDVINYGGETLRSERKVYLLLNKPKDYITTTDDPQERHTVMELIEGACKERIYPVGRLDRNTLGLLLFTNDGEVATKLMHPKHNIRKVYHVTVDRSMKAEDFKKLEEGFDLEDGFIKADEVSYVGEGKREIGIEVHSGRNRIVRRMFEHLDYEVIKLDRVVYAGLSKKDLPRGKWRFLSTKEVGFLKMLG